MINNRQQNGRRRGRGGNNGGNGGPRQGGQGRPDNGNRIDSRARGNANQLFEKYKNLAGEAQRQGDRVNTEYYLQFADHYFRVIADQRGRFEDNSQPKRQQPFDLNDDDDYGDEGEPIRAGEQDGGDQREQQGQARGDQQRDDRGNRDDRPQRRDRQDGEQRQARQWEDRGNRDDRGQQRDGNRDDRPQQREERAAREDRPQRDDRSQRDDRPQREDRVRRPRFETAEQPVEVAGQRRADPLAEGENLQERTEAVLEADAPAPRPRRGRPRRDAQPEGEAAPQTAAPVAAPVADAPESNGVDADRLPPSLNISAANDAGEEAPKPRRRRTVRTPSEVPAAE